MTQGTSLYKVFLRSAREIGRGGTSGGGIGGVLGTCLAICITVHQCLHWVHIWTKLPMVHRRSGTLLPKIITSVGP